MALTGLRPSGLPHHRTCGFPHPAVEHGGCHGRAAAKAHGTMNPWVSSVRVVVLPMVKVFAPASTSLTLPRNGMERGAFSVLAVSFFSDFSAFAVGEALLFGDGEGDCAEAEIGRQSVSAAIHMPVMRSDFIFIDVVLMGASVFDAAAAAVIRTLPDTDVSHARRRLRLPAFAKATAGRPRLPWKGAAQRKVVEVRGFEPLASSRPQRDNRFQREISGLT